MSVYCPAIVERGQQGFGVFFPDLPGCGSAADTLQAVARNAEEALQLYIDVSVEYGDEIPPPSALDAYRTDPDVAEVMRMLVRADDPARTVRLDVTLPAELADELDRRARSGGYTISGLLAEAARDFLHRDASVA